MIGVFNSVVAGYKINFEQHIDHNSTIVIASELN